MMLKIKLNNMAVHMLDPKRPETTPSTIITKMALMTNRKRPKVKKVDGNGKQDQNWAE